MNQEMMMQLLYEIYDSTLPRLAPGDDTSTKRALAFLFDGQRPRPGESLHILDLGCGTGMQTLCLARELGGKVIAVDNQRPYLAELRRRAGEVGLGDQIETRKGDMSDRELAPGPFDLVWAEGSAYNVGIRTALSDWRGRLKPGGGVGFSELVWLEDDVPDECREYFAAEYPAMAHVDAHLETLEDLGYETLGHFTVSESAWWGPYYEPLERNLEAAAERHADDPERLRMIRMFRKEIEIYRKYSRYYGYEFYLARLRG